MEASKQSSNRSCNEDVGVLQSEYSYIDGPESNEALNTGYRTGGANSKEQLDDPIKKFRKSKKKKPNSGESKSMSADVETLLLSMVSDLTEDEQVNLYASMVEAFEFDEDSIVASVEEDAEIVASLEDDEDELDLTAGKGCDSKEDDEDELEEEDDEDEDVEGKFRWAVVDGKKVRQKMKTGAEKAKSTKKNKENYRKNKSKILRDAKMRRRTSKYKKQQRDRKRLMGGVDAEMRDQLLASLEATLEAKSEWPEDFRFNPETGESLS